MYKDTNIKIVLEKQSNSENKSNKSTAFAKLKSNKHKQKYLKTCKWNANKNVILQRKNDYNNMTVYKTLYQKISSLPTNVTYAIALIYNIQKIKWYKS